MYIQLDGVVRSKTAKPVFHLVNVYVDEECWKRHSSYILFHWWTCARMNQLNTILQDSSKASSLKFDHTSTKDKNSILRHYSFSLFPVYELMCVTFCFLLRLYGPCDWLPLKHQLSINQHNLLQALHVCGCEHPHCLGTHPSMRITRKNDT